jgi:hypothetical protein
MAAICRWIDPSIAARESAAYLLDGLLPVLQEQLFSQHPGELDFDKLVAAARARQAALAAAAPKIEAVAAVAAAGSGATPTTDRDLLQRVVTSTAWIRWPSTSTAWSWRRATRPRINTPAAPLAPRLTLTAATSAPAAPSTIATTGGVAWCGFGTLGTRPRTRVYPGDSAYNCAAEKIDTAPHVRFKIDNDSTWPLQWCQ